MNATVLLCRFFEILTLCMTKLSVLVLSFPDFTDISIELHGILGLVIQSHWVSSVVAIGNQEYVCNHLLNYPTYLLQSIQHVGALSQESSPSSKISNEKQRRIMETLIFHRAKNIIFQKSSYKNRPIIIT